MRVWQGSYLFRRHCGDASLRPGAPSAAQYLPVPHTWLLRVLAPLPQLCSHLHVPRALLGPPQKQL